MNLLERDIIPKGLCSKDHEKKFSWRSGKETIPIPKAGAYQGRRNGADGHIAEETWQLHN